MGEGKRSVRSGGRPSPTASRIDNHSHGSAKTRAGKEVFANAAEPDQETSLDKKYGEPCFRSCCEAVNSACRGEQRREAGSQVRKDWSAKCQPPGKRAWRAPTPTFVSVGYSGDPLMKIRGSFRVRDTGGTCPLKGEVTETKAVAVHADFGQTRHPDAGHHHRDGDHHRGRSQALVRRAERDAELAVNGTRLRV